MVLVAGFTKYDITNDRTIASRFKMRVDLIEETDGLTKISGTEEDVAESALDGIGRYDPNA
jgi:hypothetical protein